MTQRCGYPMLSTRFTSLMPNLKRCFRNGQVGSLRLRLISSISLFCIQASGANISTSMVTALFPAPSLQEGLLHPIVTLLFLHLHDGLTRVGFGKPKEIYAHSITNTTLPQLIGTFASLEASMVCLTSWLSQDAGTLPLDARKAVSKNSSQFRETTAAVFSGCTNFCVNEN